MQKNKIKNKLSFLVYVLNFQSSPTLNRYELSLRPAKNLPSNIITAFCASSAEENFTNAFPSESFKISISCTVPYFEHSSVNDIFFT